MLDNLKSLLANQYEAAFVMLGAGIESCPEPNWHASVANLKFCQAAFHTLYFADLYLGENLKAQREQAFHREYASTFADYEELKQRHQQATYDKPFIVAYLQHCRGKARDVVETETEKSLSRRSSFKGLSRAELHVYNIRHIQHHAAQLSLRLRLDTGDGVAWVKSGPE